MIAVAIVQILESWLERRILSGLKTYAPVFYIDTLKQTTSKIEKCDKIMLMIIILWSKAGNMFRVQHLKQIALDFDG